MPHILDIFEDDAFSALALTSRVNMVPNAYGRINDLGLFVSEPIDTTSVAIEIANGVLNLLPMRMRGASASLGSPERASLKSFIVPHIPHDDAVLAIDVQNMLARAGGDPGLALDRVTDAVNRKLLTARRKHAITLEHMRAGVLRGKVLDYDGSVVLNLFTEFSVTEKAVDFALGTAGTDVAAKCREVTAYIEDNLMGDTMTGVRALASPEWMTKFLAHAKVQDAYKYFMAVQNPLREDVRRGFVFQGITFEEYRGKAEKVNEDKTRTAQSFVPAGDVRFFPEGTTDTFRNFCAPPDFIDEVNQAPAGDTEVFVAPLERMKFGKGVEMHTESNPLPLCTRPAVLVRGHSSD